MSTLPAFFTSMLSTGISSTPAANSKSAPVIELSKKEHINAFLKLIIESGCHGNKFIAGWDTDGNIQTFKPETHLGILGQSGTGKTNVMAFFALQQLAAKRPVFYLSAAFDDVEARGLLRSTALNLGSSFVMADYKDLSYPPADSLCYWAPKVGGLNPTAGIGELHDFFRNFLEDQILCEFAVDREDTGPVLLCIPEFDYFLQILPVEEVTEFFQTARKKNIRIVFSSDGSFFRTKRTSEQAYIDSLLSNVDTFLALSLEPSSNAFTRLNTLAGKSQEEAVKKLTTGNGLLYSNQSMSREPETINLPFLKE